MAIRDLKCDFKFKIDPTKAIFNIYDRVIFQLHHRSPSCALIVFILLSLACDRVFSSMESTIISSEGFHEGNYPNDQDCTYYIQAGMNQIVEITFDHFDLELSKNCKYDYVEVSIHFTFVYVEVIFILMLENKRYPPSLPHLTSPHPSPFIHHAIGHPVNMKHNMTT